MFKLNRKIRQAGMSYVELIVVLSIFSVLSGVVMFNHQVFQNKIDINNLASDIASKIVDAQRSSLAGLLPPSAKLPQNPNIWKPSYGIYFDLGSPKQFIYFVDSGMLSGYESEEELDTIHITKDNYISRIDKCVDVDCSSGVPITSLSITFKRPDSRAIFTDPSGVPLVNLDYVQITVSSPSSIISKIKIYNSGRVQVN